MPPDADPMDPTRRAQMTWYREAERKLSAWHDARPPAAASGRGRRGSSPPQVLATFFNDLPPADPGFRPGDGLQQARLDPQGRYPGKPVVPARPASAATEALAGQALANAVRSCAAAAHLSADDQEILRNRVLRALYGDPEADKALEEWKVEGMPLVLHQLRVAKTITAKPKWGGVKP